MRFLLGDKDGLTLRRLAAYRDAKRDIARGRVPPFETLEGLRSRFHRDKTIAEVLELTRKWLANISIGLKNLATRPSEAQVEEKMRTDPSLRLRCPNPVAGRPLPPAQSTRVNFGASVKVAAASSTLTMPLCL